MATKTEARPKNKKEAARALRAIIEKLENVIGQFGDQQPGENKLLDSLWNAKELMDNVLVELDPSLDS